jgi:uncharacterized membrane protein
MKRGIALGAGAYLLWGVLPIFWKALETVDSLEILAHRIIWSVVLLAAIVRLRRSWSQIRNLGRDSLIRLLIAGSLLSLNWATYIWAVNNGHIVESSLGYFINPLLNVALGVMILRERLDPPDAMVGNWNRHRRGCLHDDRGRLTPLDRPRPGLQLRHIRVAQEADDGARPVRELDRRDHTGFGTGIDLRGRARLQR